ncbi:MAG: aminopeptidase [Mycobacteriaceae bacterium]|nr:aminopeptidase [Mycobacteriaceae bacterium]
MTLRRLVLLVGAVLLIAGVVALLVPVTVSGGSGGSSESVGCGNAVASDLSAARSADDRSGGNVPVLNQFIPHSNYVADCQSALSHRRAWSIPLAVIGVLGVAGGLLVSARPGTRAGGIAP